jgi:hypothetical protein
LTETEPEGRSGKLGVASIWCDKDLLKDFRATVKLQGRLISEEFNTFFVKRTAELRGLAAPNSPNSVSNREQQVELMRKRRYDLHVEELKIEKFLRDEHVYDKALSMFYEVATGTPEKYGTSLEDVIKAVLETVDDDVRFRFAVAKFLMKYKDESFAYDFERYLKTVKEKRRLQQQLLQYRLESLGEEERKRVETEEEGHNKDLPSSPTIKIDVVKEHGRKDAESEEEEERKREREESERETERIIAESDAEESEEDGEENITYVSVGTNGRIQEEDEDETEKEGLDVVTDPVPLEKEFPEECHAIVPVGKQQPEGK